MTKANEPIWTAEGAQKRSAVRAMFAEIAPSYDRVNGLISFSLHKRWRQQAVSQLCLNPGERVLDVCCGTGDFFEPLRRAVGPTGVVAGIDFCAPMLLEAQKKPLTGGRLALGDAGNLPVASGQFHGVSIGWGIRNVPNIDAAHSEVFRVLRPGGRFVSLDMARPRNPLIRGISEFVFGRLVPLIGSFFGNTTAYTYLPKSTERFWSREQLAASMERAGLTDVRTTDILFGNLCIHSGTKPL